MCVTSMVMEHYQQKWLPLVPPPIFPPWPSIPFPPPQPKPIRVVSPEEVEEFRQLLERAREYDRKHNEPDCELDDKRTALRKIADALGLKIDFV